MITGIDHVQLAMPPGGEDAARGFYSGVLGLTELPKPGQLRASGGVWFAPGIHLGVEPGFRPARKAHPGLSVDDLDGLAARLGDEGYEVSWDDRRPGVRRFHTFDPFGNRLELLAGG